MMQGALFLLCCLGWLATVQGRIVVNAVGGRPDLKALLKARANANGQSEAIDQGECQASRFYPASGDDSNCRYMKCANGKKVETRCPSGVGPPSSFRNEPRGEPANGRGHPCTSPSNGCKRTMSDKGVGDVNVNVCGVDLCFIVDVSCSINDVDKRKVKEFITGAVENIGLSRIGTELAVIAYHKEIVNDILDFNMMEGKNTRRAVVKINKDLPTTDPSDKTKCGTNTNGALRYAREELFNRALPESKRADAGEFDVRSISGERTGRQDVCFVLTDGATHPPENHEDTLTQADLLKKHGVTVNLITLPNDGIAGKNKEFRNKMEDEFQAIPSSPQHRFDMTNFDELQELLNDIKDLSCRFV